MGKRPIVGLLAFVAAGSAPPVATAQQRIWLAQFGTQAQDFPLAIAPDSSGGFYVAGLTSGGLAAPHPPHADAFLARFDRNGARLWVRQFGAPETDYATSLAADSQGGVLVSGFTQGNLAGPNAGDRDAFIGRFDSAGNQVWMRQFGTPGGDTVSGASPDGMGGVFVSGSTTGALGGPPAGFNDVFLARYDATGTQLWLRQFGTALNDSGDAVAADGAGGVFVAGQTDGALAGPSAGGIDAYVAKYTAAGAPVWIRQFGTSNSDWISAVAADGAGGAFITGPTSGTLAGPFTFSLDAFLTRYDSGGTRLWIRQLGTNATEYVHGLALGSGGDVFIAGDTLGSLGAPGAGGQEVFVAKYNTAGTQQSVAQFGVVEWSNGRAIVSDGAGGVFLAGQTKGSLGAPNLGIDDVFVARLGPACYANCDWSTAQPALNVADFTCFLSAFSAGTAYSNCDYSTRTPVSNVSDFLCFVNRYAAGCP